MGRNKVRRTLQRCSMSKVIWRPPNYGVFGGLQANPSVQRLECRTGRVKEEWLTKMMQRETQDVNNLEYEGQKEGRLRFLERLLHPRNSTWSHLVLV